jgi:hypothetical protein
MVPSLYVGVACAIDSFPAALRATGPLKSSLARLAAAALAVAGLAVSVDLAQRGIVNVRVGRPSDSNHQLDDRAALAQLLAFRRPGDSFLSTRLGLPAVWWYGGIPGGARGYDASLHPDGGRVWLVSFDPAARDCSRSQGLETLAGSGRVLVYFGFRFDDMPRGFDAMLMNRLRQRGRIVSDRTFAELSRAVVVEMSASNADAEPHEQMPESAGCMSLTPAATR